VRLRSTVAAQVAVIVLIAVAGILGAVNSLQQPPLLAAILSLMGLGYLGIGLGELRAAGKDAAPPSTAKDDPDAKPAQLEGELVTIDDLIQSHLDANGDFSHSLAEANKNLPPLTNPEKVRAIVHLLIDANRKMQSKTSHMARSLEKSRSRVAALRSRLRDAKALGMRDSLTALGNRRFFDSRLAREIIGARAQGTEMCLVLGDLDHFKEINDSFGHPFGDRVLKHFAELLTKHIRATDIAARFGGEEFAVILPQTSLEHAKRLTDQIRNRLETQEWINLQNGRLYSRITASFGVVRLGEDDDRETLVNRADAMLYQAKRAGRNRIMVESAA
jgi:diguanylate cyclase